MGCNFRKVLLSLLSSCLLACAEPNKEEVKLSTWLSEMVQMANIEPSNTKEPYFLTIPQSHPQFQLVQTAVDWNMISNEIPLNLESSLSKEWLAYTLVHFLQEKSESGMKIQDVNKSQFPKEIQQAVSLGLFSLDNRNLFHPKELVNLAEAKEKFRQVLRFIEEKDLGKGESQLNFQKDLEIKELPLDRFDEQHLSLQTKDEKVGMVFKKDRSFYQIESIDQQKAKLIPIHPLELSDNLSFQGESKLDFRTLQSGPQVMGSSFLEKSISILGYQGSMKTTDQGITFSLEKPLAHQAKAYLEVSLEDFRVKYDWQSKGRIIPNALVQFRFHSSQRVGIRKDNGKEMELSKNIDPKELVNFLFPKEQFISQEIPLGHLSIPLANLPQFSIGIQVKALLSMKGELQVRLHQQQRLGFHIRNNHLRWIKEANQQHYLKSQATSKALSQIQVSLNAMDFPLANFALQGGLDLNFQDKVVFYEKGNQLRELEGPFYPELQQQKGPWKYCSQHAIQWILEAQMNDDKSLLGKLGFKGNLPLLSQEQAQIYHGKKPGMAACRLMPPLERDPIIYQDGFGVERLSYSLKKGQKLSLEILELPNGYRLSDLEVEVLDPSILLHSFLSFEGKKEGATRIKIQTKDQKHQLYLTMMVLS